MGRGRGGSERSGPMGPLRSLLAPPSLPRLRRRCPPGAASHPTATTSRASHRDGAPAPAPLVRLDGTRLAYPPHHPAWEVPIASPPLSLEVLPPPEAGGGGGGGGGHALLGRNGSGKSLLHLALAHGLTADAAAAGAAAEAAAEEEAGEEAPSSPYVIGAGAGGMVRFPRGSGGRGEILHPISAVSFGSHRTLLEGGGSVRAALCPRGGGRPSRAAQFLIVRFGLYPLLNRSVGTLSTGEVRRVLLVRALSTRPSLLLLDNAFDGLDVPGRAGLSDLLSRTLRGFRNDLLVQGVDARNAARTQVLLATHRAEEIVGEIGTVSWMGRGGGGRGRERGKGGA